MKQDYDLKDFRLDDCEISNQNAQRWFDTSDFAILYGNATRVFVVPDVNEIRKLGFYKVEKCWGVFRRLSFTGPFQAENNSLQELLQQHRAHYAKIPFFHELSLREFSAHNEKWKIVRHAEDVVIKLPASLNDYLASLGRQTRKHLPYYARRLEREWNTRLEYKTFRNNHILLEHFQDLVEFNRARMSHKRSRSGWTDQMIENRCNLAKKSGLLVSVCLDGRIEAGTICFLHRQEAYLALISHNPTYDSLNLGNIVLVKTIEKLIELGYQNLHLLWGQFFYKKQFGGAESPLFEINVVGDSVRSNIVWECISTSKKITDSMRNYLKPFARKLRDIRK